MKRLDVILKSGGTITTGVTGVSQEALLSLLANPADNINLNTTEGLLVLIKSEIASMMYKDA